MSRKIFTTSTKDPQKSIVVVQYSVDVPYGDKLNRTLKDVAFMLSDSKADENSIIEDVKFFGASYLRDTPNLQEYYVLSEKELKLDTNLGNTYLKSKYPTGRFVQSFNVTENDVLKEQLEYLFSTNVENISECSDQKLADSGLNGFKNEKAYPNIKSEGGLASVLNSILFLNSLVAVGQVVVMASGK